MTIWREMRKDESFGESKKIGGSVDEKVLVATVGIARRVGVVLEQVDVASDALLSESLLGIHTQPFQDPLPARSWVINCCTLSHSAVAYSGWLPTSRYSRDRCAEDIAASAPCNNASKQIARYFIGTEPVLSPERAGDAVFGFNSEDAAIHVSTVGFRLTTQGLAGPAAGPPGSRLPTGGTDAWVEVLSKMATSRSSGLNVRRSSVPCWPSAFTA